MRHVSRSHERGMVLWATVLMVLLIGGLSTAFLVEGLGERTAIEHRKTSTLALEIAEMGAVRATLEITALSDPDGDGIGTLSGSFSGGDYEAVAVQDATYPDRWRITVRGTYRLSTKRIELGLRRRQDGDWIEGLFARDGLTFNGDISTDSYDSRLGTYASQATNTDTGGTHARLNGHVGSNATIRTTGSAMHVRGNAIPGPLSQVESSGSPTITGDTLPRRDSIDLPDPDLADFQAAMAVNSNADIKVSSGGGTNKNGGGGGKPPYDSRTMSLVATGQKIVTLEGGTYFFRDIRLTGGAELRVTSASVIYVTGQFDLGGGTLTNTTGIPANLRVYAHPYALPGGTVSQHSEVSVSGGAGAALAVYAPEVDITVNGDADVYGAMVGRTIKSTGNAYYHYDEALGAFNEYAKVYVERLYWRELSEGNLR